MQHNHHVSQTFYHSHTRSGSCFYHRLFTPLRSTTTTGETTASILRNTSTIETVAQWDMFLDDFTIDSKGIAWIAVNCGNVVIAVGRDGKVVTVAGSADQLTIAGYMSAVFWEGGRR
jgi:hypothetical protein